MQPEVGRHLASGHKFAASTGTPSEGITEEMAAASTMNGQVSVMTIPQDIIPHPGGHQNFSNDCSSGELLTLLSAATNVINIRQDLGASAESVRCGTSTNHACYRTTLKARRFE